MVRALNLEEVDERKFLGQLAAHPHRDNFILYSVENRDFCLWIAFANFSNAGAVIVVLDQQT